jgi:hypothetical protein
MAAVHVQGDFITLAKAGTTIGPVCTLKVGKDLSTKAGFTE